MDKDMIETALQLAKDRGMEEPQIVYTINLEDFGKDEYLICLEGRHSKRDWLVAI